MLGSFAPATGEASSTVSITEAAAHPFWIARNTSAWSMAVSIVDQSLRTGFTSSMWRRPIVPEVYRTAAMILVGLLDTWAVADSYLKRSALRISGQVEAGFPRSAHSAAIAKEPSRR